jgi:hypothetical protein
MAIVKLIIKRKAIKFVKSEFDKNSRGFKPVAIEQSLFDYFDEVYTFESSQS